LSFLWDRLSRGITKQKTNEKDNGLTTHNRLMDFCGLGVQHTSRPYITTTIYFWVAVVDNIILYICVYSFRENIVRCFLYFHRKFHMQSFKKGKEKNKSLFFLLPSLVAVLSFFSRDSAMRVPINSGRVTCPKIRKK
jgi:hypothetical protein